MASARSVPVYRAGWVTSASPTSRSASDVVGPMAATTTPPSRAARSPSPAATAFTADGDANATASTSPAAIQSTSGQRPVRLDRGHLGARGDEPRQELRAPLRRTREEHAPPADARPERRRHGLAPRLRGDEVGLAHGAREPVGGGGADRRERPAGELGGREPQRGEALDGAVHRGRAREDDPVEARKLAERGVERRGIGGRRERDGGELAHGRAELGEARRERVLARLRAGDDDRAAIEARRRHGPAA